MTAGEYCNREVIIVEPNVSVTEAAVLMRRHHVGDLVVVEKSGEATRPVGVGDHESVAGSYRAPLSRYVAGHCFPPQAIISLPVQTMVWSYRPGGAETVVIAVQVSLTGS